MLRTTISKIKKVCTVAFVPRILRGDQRCTSGRFEILSYAVLKKAQKSTKSSDDDEFEHKKEKHKDGYECMFAPKEPKLPQDKSDGEKNTTEKMFNESITPLVAARALPKETHDQKCQRLIDKAFSNDNIEPTMGEQYFSHSSFEIKETRNEINKAEMLKYADESKIDKPVTDDRIQYGSFKTPDLTAQKTPDTSVEPDDLIMNESILKATAKNKNSNLMPQTATTDCKPNFVQKETPNYNCNNWNTQHFGDSKTVHATTTEEPEEQLTQKLEHIDETPLVEAPKPNIEGLNVTPRVLGDIAPTFNCFCNKSVDNLTAGASSKVDIPSSYDEVAKRCLDSPTSQIDEILLKEMEKLGIPITSNRDSNSRSPVIEDDLVQMDVLRKRPRRPLTDKKELDLESHEYERGAVDLYKTTKVLYPARYVSNEVLLPEMKPETVELQYERVLNREKGECDHSFESIESTVGQYQTTDLLDRTDDILQDSTGTYRLTVHPNQVIIDPYDKKTIAFDTGEYDPNEEYDPSKKNSYFYIPIAEETLETTNEIDVMTPVEETEINNHDDIYTRKTQLDPTAPISAQDSTKISNTKSMNQLKSPGKHEQVIYTNETETANMLKMPRTGVSHATWNKEQLQFSSNDTPAQRYLKGNDTTTNNQPHLCIAQLNPKEETELQKTWPQNINAPYSFDQKDTSANYNTEQFELDPTTIKTVYLKPFSQLKGSAHSKPAEPEEHKAYATKTEVVSSFKSPKIKKPQKSVPGYLWDELATNPEQISKAADDGVVSCSLETPQAVTEPSIWEKEHLDPKHVLTCNETCPISPRPPHVNACETIRLAGTESIYENDFNEIESKDPTPSEPLSEHESYKLSSSKMNEVSNFMQAESVPFSPLIKEQDTDQNASDTPADNMTVTIPTDSSLPKLNEDVSLSELLRRVRERSRIRECRTELKYLGVEVEPAEGKCRTKAPRCPPTAPRSPPNNPIPPPTFGLPPLKRRPPACKPRRKNPSQTKCSSCDLDISPSLQLGPKINSQMSTTIAGIACDMNNVVSEFGVIRPRSKVDLTNEVIDRLEILGKKLVGQFRQGKTEVLEASVLLRSERSKILLARDYEPWAPIPSWPTMKKQVQRKPRCRPGCSDPGCKVFPPPRVCHDPPCEQKPCVCFPKKHFSLLDCFAVSLGDHKVYDLGEF